MVQPYYRKGQRNPNYIALLDSNALWRKRQTAAAPGSGGGVSAVFGTLLGAYATHEQAKAEASRQTQQMQIIRALDKNIKVLGEREMGQKRWQVTWQNRNSVSLRSVVMGVLLKDRKGKVYRFVTHIKGNIAPGQRFSGQFVLDKLTLSDIKRMQVKYYLDDAKPYR